MNLRYSFWLVTFFAFSMSCNDIRVKKEENIPFEKLSPKSTGIYFSNIITPNIETSENLFDYDYFYNGSGVGIADINNDGLKDVLFTNRIRNEYKTNHIKTRSEVQVFTSM